MNWLDFGIIVALVGFAFTGLGSGLLRELAALIAALVGVVLAGQLYRRLAGDITIVHGGAQADQLIAFLAIFAAVVLAGEIGGTLLGGASANLLLGRFNALGGIALGVIRGAVVVETVLIAFAAFPAAGWMSSALNTSLLAPLFLHGAAWLLSLLPGMFRQGAQAF